MNLKQYRERHPEHLGEAGGYCITCALIDALKEERNKVLDEVKREVEKKSFTGTIGYYDELKVVSFKDISTIIDQLKLK